MDTNVQKNTSHYEKYIKTRLERDPEYRTYLYKHSVAYITNRRKNDEEFRVKCSEIDKKTKQNRYANDPVYREQKKAAAKERYRLNRLKKEKVDIEEVIN